MHKESDFDKFLHWLDPDRERAAEKYEFHRRRLTKFFEGRGFWLLAPELTDEVFDRVVRKLAGGTDIYVSPGVYFFGVARYVALEAARIPKHEEIPPDLPGPDTHVKAKIQSCADECFHELPPVDKRLHRRYYQAGTHAKTERERMAGRLGITPNALRIRAHRVQKKIEVCVDECVKN